MHVPSIRNEEHIAFLPSAPKNISLCSTQQRVFCKQSAVSYAPRQGASSAVECCSHVTADTIRVPSVDSEHIYAVQSSAFFFPAERSSYVPSRDASDGVPAYYTGSFQVGDGSCPLMLAYATGAPAVHSQRSIPVCLPSSPCWIGTGRP